MSNTQLFVLTQDGTVWKPIRKLMNPAFSLNVLKSSMSIYHDETSLLLENLNHKVQKTEFDIFPLVNVCTLRMLCGNL